MTLETGLKQEVGGEKQRNMGAAFGTVHFVEIIFGIHVYWKQLLFRIPKGGYLNGIGLLHYYYMAILGFYSGDKAVWSGIQDLSSLLFHFFVSTIILGKGPIYRKFWTCKFTKAINLPIQICLQRMHFPKPKWEGLKKTKQLQRKMKMY